MVIETQRLLIRPFDSADWEDLHEYLSDGQVVRFEPYGVFTADESRQEAVRRSNDPAFWAVCLKDGGKLIGNLYLAGQSFDTWELGYVFNARYQGKGYATEAAEALLERGAKEVYACATHGVLSGPAIERIKGSQIKKLVVSDTIPLPPEKQIDKIQSLTIAPLFAEALRRIHSEHSVSILFR